jgi:hypothetical protein
MNPEDPANWHSLNDVYERVLAQLDAQNDRWESIDGRLRVILGLIGVVFAISSSFAARGTGGPPGEPTLLPFWVGTLLIAGLALYFTGGLIALTAYWPLTFHRPPQPADLRNEYLTTDPRITRLEIVDTILLVYPSNEHALQVKFRAYRFALVLTTMATGLFGAAVIIQLLMITRRWG